MSDTIFSINYVNKFVITSFARRKRYPKTTIGAATADHPAGFASLDEAFQWSDFFMTRLANRFGKDWLCDRLRSWRWTFSSAFSGVGAPESAQNLDVEFICNTHSFAPKTFRDPQYLAFVNLCEALASLESAARTFLTSCGCHVPTHPKVLYEFTCEVDEYCMEVLRKTYNMPCNWPDITTFNHRKKFQYCSTHKKMCKVRKNRSKNRFSVQFARLVVVFG